MTEIIIAEFAANCLEILERVRLTKTPIRITQDGKPVAEIVPITPVMDRAQWMDSMKGKMEFLGDIISPANDEDEWDWLRN